MNSLWTPFVLLQYLISMLISWKDGSFSGGIIGLSSGVLKLVFEVSFEINLECQLGHKSVLGWI